MLDREVVIEHLDVLKAQHSFSEFETKLINSAIEILKKEKPEEKFEKAEKNEYTCHYQTQYGERNYKVEDVREWIGSYVAYDKPPETEAKKAKMISNAVASIMKIAEKLVENGTHIDWNTTTIIVKEGIDVFTRSPDWYKNEPSPPGWRMTVGIKIKADQLK